MAEQKRRKITCHAQFSDILFPFLKTKESVKITKEIMFTLTYFVQKPGRS